MKESHAGTLEKLAQLSLAQIKTLRVKGAIRGRRTHIPPLVPQERVSQLPLSYAQERMWFLDRLGLVGPAYNMGMVHRLVGTLSVAVLARSFSELVRRHESLRMRFEAMDGRPLAVIDPPRPFELEVRDLSALSDEDRARQSRQLSSDEAQRHFELSNGPLLRATLLKLGPQEHVLLITIHHIVTDGWSWGLLHRELSALYGAYSQEKTSPLSALPVQYADYAIWQRQWLQGEVLSEQVKYWKEQLLGAPTQLDLPTDRPRPAIGSFKGSTLSFELPVLLVEALKELALHEAATLFMVILAAYQLLLSRWSGQQDFVVGSPIAGRMNREVEDLIGLFVNTLVLRMDASGEPTFRQLLERVKKVTLGAYARQELPFEVLVKELRPERDLTRQPIFQVVLALHNFPEQELKLPGLTWTWADAERVTTQFDLTLHLYEHANGLSGMFEYATDLFDRETIERMAGHFRTLLEGIVANPDRPIQDLPLLSESEQRQILEEWTVTAPYSKKLQIQELFEEQVGRTPDAIAVTCEDEHLTYAELNARANRLARYLRRKGVGPDHLVGLCVERSLEMVIGVLGILKSGGAYLPLDPNYPAERLAHMLEDAGPRIVLTQQRLQEKLPSTSAQTILLDNDWHEIAELTPGDPEWAAASDRAHHLAYVIYTSGSTGEPKGVMVEHRNVTRLFAATEKWFNFNERDVCTLFHSLAFDFSVWELWGALLYGGRVVVVPHLIARAPQEFYRLLCKEGVTVLSQTPSAFARLINAQARSEQEHSLRVVVFGGEALEPRTLRPWVKRNGADKPQLVNMYGITETTVHVTYRCLSKGEIESERGSLIGKTIPDLRAYLLDRYGQPVPIGIAGEIYVGGDGVARGYLNRPELTAERFRPDPFSTEPRARVYKTGDLARWRGDGSLEYLGRNDHQVKIRGYRIELGEIEAQLVRNAQVKEAIVLAREDEPGEKRLVAYVIPKDGVSTEACPTVESLRAQLNAVLPEYMIPSAFVTLESFPLTSNGKLNRAALPVPDEHAVALRQYVAPRTELERKLCEIWSQVVGLARVGIEDNFFAIGGDSILSLRVLARSEEAGVSVGVADLFRHQNIAQLARAIEAGGRVRVQGTKIEAFDLLSSKERSQFASVPGLVDAYPLSLLQEGMYFHSELEPDRAVYHDVFSYCIEDEFHREHFEHAVRDIAQRHPILRTGFVLSCDDRLVQVVHDSATVPVHVEDISELSPTDQGRHLREWIGQEKYRAFAWSEPPLLRAFVHVRAPRQFQYSLSFHHAILDGWSVASLQTELLSHYFSLMNGRELLIAAPQAMYRDYIAREREALESHSSESYWQELLEGASRRPLPKTGNNTATVKGRDVDEFTLSFQPSIGQGLEMRARQLGVHLKLLLLAAHVKVMSLICGAETVLTGMVSHGRLEAEDGARVLGLHLNSLPLRFDLRESSWCELILQLRDLEQAMLPHRYYPLAAIQKLTGGEQLIDTLFNFTRFHVYREVEEAAKVSETELFEQTSFSLLVNFSQEPNGPGISLSLGFDPAVFDRTQIGRIGGYYERALTRMLDDINSSHNAETLLSETELNELLVQFNNTADPYPAETRVHELFERQAERTPDDAAAIYEGQSLTYAELNRRANQLAEYLKHEGVGPDRLVGICIERSVELVVGILGILKAGGAYVPLDPNYPTERLHYMLQDADPQVILTQEKLRTVLPITVAKVIAVDFMSEEIARYGDKNLSAVEPGQSSQNLVYVIYTSGSTGRPKGVAMSHRSMVNLIEWHRNSFSASEAKRVLQFAALSFDVAFQEIFSTLCTGGTLILIDEWTRRDAGALSAFLSRQSIQRLFVPPLMLHSLAESLENMGDVPSSLTDVITAGEQLRISPEISRLFNRLNRCRLHNHYGPTESHVVTALTLRGAPDDWPVLPSIGQPIANAQIYVVDGRRQPVPIGVPGEIYIGGANVARGYLHRPELTAHRFIADPFSTDQHARLYKTGDLGRWLTNGTLEYLGRNDDQVKIRGHRVELGEIEAELVKHSQVREAAVVLREDVPSEKRLVAYVTQREGSGPSAESLRAHLKQILPDHMVPSAFAVLESLPLTPSGKLDRRALPVPQSEAYASQEYETPQGEIEAALANIWQELLHVERVSRRDHFFEIGGHSLVATRVIARIREMLHVELSIKTLFVSPTLEKLSVCVEDEISKRAARDALRTNQLARNLRQEISEMQDDAVLARIAELEKELSQGEGGPLAQDRAESLQRAAMRVRE